MNESLIDNCFLLFMAAVFLGPLAGWLIGRRAGFERGMVVGCLTIGLVGAACALVTAVERWQFLGSTTLAEGRLSGWVAERVKDSDGNVSVSQAPEIAYMAADGVERRLKGLGGSQRDKKVGDAVPVRHRINDPAAALIDDTQNIWGPVIAFGLFGGFPLLFGAFFWFSSGEPAAAQRQLKRPRLSRADEINRRLWAQRLIIAGNLTLFVSLMGMGFLPLPVEVVLSLIFLMVSLACIFYGIAMHLRGQRDRQAIGVLVVIGVGFAAFAGVLLLLS